MILLSTVICIAQEEFVFEKITIADGLSQSMITSIAQDSSGYMWFGTKDGLNRYDGYKFSIYRHDRNDERSISNNYINSIYVDKIGGVWISTPNGLNLYDQTTDSFIRINPVDNKTGDSILTHFKFCYEDSKGNLWAGSESAGLFIFDRELKKFTKCYRFDQQNPDAIPARELTIMIESSKGKYYLGSNENGFICFSPEDGSFSTVDMFDGSGNGVSQVSDIIEDENGVILICSAASGLFTLDQNSNRIFPLKGRVSNSDEPMENGFVSLFADDANNLWVSTDNGLYFRKSGDEKFKLISHTPGNPQSLSINNIGVVYQDINGLIWIGTKGLGICTYSKYRYKFGLYRVDLSNQSSLDNDYIYSILEDSNGYLWVGGTTGRLTRVNREKGVAKYYNYLDAKGIAVEPGFSSLLEDDSGRIWATSRIGDVVYYDPELDEVKLFLNSNSAKNCLKLSDGRIVIGTEYHGIFVISLDPMGRVMASGVEQKDLGEGGRVFSLFQDSKDNIWIGGERGIFKTDSSFALLEEYSDDSDGFMKLSDNAILSIGESSDGRMLIGTRDGLNVLDFEKGTNERIDVSRGLPNNVIYGVLEDDNHNFWISTNKGLCRADNSFSKITAYTKSHGLQENEFNTGAYFKSKTGELFFGGISGLNYFFPENIVKNQIPPNIVISSFKVFRTNEYVPVIVNSGDVIELSHDENFVSFEFAALDYCTPEKNNYRYFLENLDKKWIDSTNRRFVNYNLNPGSYTFKVHGSNGDGVWSKDPATLKIIVFPPWWDTNWFKALVVVLVISITVATFFIRGYSIRLQRDRLRKEVALRTKELSDANKELETFSYTVSHDLKTPLRHILGYSRILQDEYDGEMPRTLDNALGKIDLSVKKMDKLISDILQLTHAGRNEINKSNFNMSIFARDSIKQLKTLSPDRSGQVVIEESIEAFADPDLISIVIDNLIGNAWKYTEKKAEYYIEVGSFNKDKKKYIFIKDNGIGFDMQFHDSIYEPFKRLRGVADFEGTGIGLSTVAKIIHRHGGSIYAESKPGEGTTFFFTLGD